MKYSLILICLLVFSNLSFSQNKMDIFDIARKGTLEQIKELYNQNPKLIHDVNKEGYSALILACYKSNNEVAKFLIENGSDINGSSSMGTPLMAAVVKGNNEIAKLLIEKKANVNFADANGTTALIYSIQFSNKTILAMLLEHKANKLHKDKDGKTAFEHAVFAGNEEIINMLK